MIMTGLDGVNGAYGDALRWIADQKKAMAELTAEWSAINSFSYNLAGLAKMCAAIRKQVEPLGDAVKEHEIKPHRVLDDNGATRDIELGKLLTVSTRPQAQRRVLVGIHMDTVFPPESDFQEPYLKNDKTLCGPGVMDAKGGLVVLLTALRAFETLPTASQIGWELFVNPDEEIGSPGSESYFDANAANFEFGMIFEPTADDGALINARKGGGRFAFVVHGRAAHAGRNPQDGRNAITHLAKLALEVEKLRNFEQGVLLNIGLISGGTSNNVVPALAVARCDMRVTTADQGHATIANIKDIVDRFNTADGYKVEMHGGMKRPPKQTDDGTRELMNEARICANMLDFDEPRWATVGGVTDGNNLAAVGLSNLDSLGVTGGGAHSPQEFLKTDSLTTQAKLAFLLLARFAERTKGGKNADD